MLISIFFLVAGGPILVLSREMPDTVLYLLWGKLGVAVKAMIFYNIIRIKKTNLRFLKTYFLFFKPLV